jgi:hypothetical protein
MVPADEGEHEQHERPGHVELLLDGERPEVVERPVRVLLREVVGRLGGQPDVHRVAARRRDVVRHRLRADRPEQEARRDGDADDREDRLRHQSLDPSCVEPPQADAPAAFELAGEEAGDQEARDHEEDVNADVAAAGEPEPGVRQHHEPDRDRPQALDVRAEPRPGRLGGHGDDLPGSVVGLGRR